MKVDTTMETFASPCLRPMMSEQSLLSRPDGSAVFHQGDTAIMAAVYGPAEVLIRKELVDRSTIELTYSPKSGMSGCAERSKETYLRQTCENVILASLHPRTCIRIVLQELQDSGSLAACAINAACLALLDAAIPLKHTVAAVICIIDDDDQITLDPTKKQEAEHKGQLLFAFDSRDNNVITCVSSGVISDELYTRGLCMCREASKGVFAFYREAMQKQFNKIAWKWEARSHSSFAGLLFTIFDVLSSL